MLKNALDTLKVREFKENIKHDENQYLNLIEDIINHGVMVNGRNGNIFNFSKKSKKLVKYRFKTFCVYRYAYSNMHYQPNFQIQVLFR